MRPPCSANALLVDTALDALAGKFTFAGLARACPGVGPEMVHGVLPAFQKAGKVVCLGCGPEGGLAENR